MSALDAAREELQAIRRDPQRRRQVTVGTVVLGLGLAWFHWLGLVLGGALVALPRRRARFAPLAGLGFGLLVLVVFGAYLAFVGSLGPALGMGQITIVTAAMGLLLPAYGSILRGAI